MGLFEGFVNFTKDYQSGIDELRSDFSSLFNKSIAKPVSNFLDESKYANNDTLLGKGLDFVGNAIGNTVDAIGDVASDVISFQPVTSTLEAIDFARSEEIGEIADEQGKSRFEVGLERFWENNKEGISDLGNVASLFVGGGTGAAVGKAAAAGAAKVGLGGFLKSGALKLGGKVGGAVAPAFLGESATLPGIGVGFASLGLAELNESFQDSIGRKNAEAIYDKLGVENLGDQYASRLMRFTDKLDFDNISQADVTAFNESLGDGVKAETIQDLQNIVKGVNQGIGFTGRAKSNIASGFDELSGILFSGAAADDQFEAKPSEVKVIESDEGVEPTITVSVDTQRSVFSEKAVEATNRNAKIISDNIQNIQTKFGINEDRFIQTSVNRFQSVISRFNDASDAVAVTEDLLNNEKNPAKRREIQEKLDQQIKILGEYETRLDAVVELTEAEITSEEVDTFNIFDRDEKVVDTKSSDKEVRSEFDLGAADPLDRIKKLQFQADGAASKDNSSKISADFLGNMGRILGTAGSNLAILTDSFLDVFGKDDFNTLLKYGVENTTNEAGLPRNLWIDIVDGSDKVIPYVSLFAAERLFKIPKNLVSKNTKLNAQDYLNNSPFWKNVTGKGSKTNEKIVSGIRGGAGETAEELIQLGIEGAGQIDLLSSDEVLASTVIAQGVGSITNVMNIVDKYSKRPISNQETLTEFVKNNENRSDIPVVVSRDQAREATIEAVANIVSKEGDVANLSGSTFTKQALVLGSIDAGTKAIAARTKQIEGQIFKTAQESSNFAVDSQGNRFQVYSNETWDAIKRGSVDSDLEIKYTPEALTEINTLVSPTIKQFKKDISELTKIAYEPSSNYKFDAETKSFIANDTSSSNGKSDMLNFVDLYRQYNGKSVTKNGQPINSGGQRVKIKDLLGVDESMTQEDFFAKIKEYSGKNTSKLYQSLFNVNNNWLWDNATAEVLNSNGKRVKVKTKRLSSIGAELINSDGFVGKEFDKIMGDNVSNKLASDMEDYVNALRGTESTFFEGQPEPKDVGVLKDEEGNIVSEVSSNLRVSLDIKSGSNKIYKESISEEGILTLEEYPSDVSGLLIEWWNAKNRWDSNFNSDGDYTGNEYERKDVGGATVLVGKPDKRYAHPDVYFNLLKGKYPGLVESIKFFEIDQGKDLNVNKEGEVEEFETNGYSSIEYLSKEDIKELGILGRNYKRINLLLNRYFNFGSEDFSSAKFKNTKIKFEYAKSELKKFENENFKIPTGRRAKFRGSSIDSSLWASSLIAEYDPIIQNNGSEEQKDVWSFITQDFLTKLYTDFKGSESEVTNFVVGLMNINKKSTGRYNVARAKKLLNIMLSDKSIDVKRVYLEPQKYNDFGELNEGSIKKIPASALLVFGNEAPFTLNVEFAQSVWKILARYSVLGNLEDTVLDRQNDDHHKLAYIKAKQFIDAGLFKGKELNKSFTFEDYYNKNIEDLNSESVGKIIDGLNDRLSQGSEVNNSQLYQLMNAIGLSIKKDKVPNFKAHISNLKLDGKEIVSIAGIQSAYTSFVTSPLANGTVIALAMAKVSRKKSVVTKKRKSSIIGEKFDGKILVEKDGSINIMRNLINYLNGKKVDINAVDEILSLAVALNVIDEVEAKGIVQELYQYQQNQLYLAQVDEIVGEEIVFVAGLISKSFFNPNVNYSDVQSYPDGIRVGIEGVNSSNTGLTSDELLEAAEDYLVTKKEAREKNKEINSKYSQSKEDGKYTMTEKLFLEIFPVEKQFVKIKSSKRVRVKKSKSDFMNELGSISKSGKGTPSLEGIRPVGKYGNFLLGLGFSIGSANWKVFVKKAVKLGFTETNLRRARESYIKEAKNLKNSGVVIQNNQYEYTDKMVGRIIGRVPNGANEVIQEEVEEEVTLEYAEARMRANKSVNIESLYDKVEANPSSDVARAIAIAYLERTENIESIRDILDASNDEAIISEAKSAILRLVEDGKYTQGEAEGLFPDIANVEKRVYNEQLQENMNATNDVQNEINNIKTGETGFFDRFLPDVAGRIRNKIPKFNQIHESFLDYFSNKIAPSLNLINNKTSTMKEEELDAYLRRIEEIRQSPSTIKQGEEYIGEFFDGIRNMNSGIKGNRALKARLISGIDKEITFDDLRNLRTVGMGGLLTYLKYYNQSTYKDILPDGDNVDGFVSMFGAINGDTASTELTPLRIKTLFDAYGREKLTSWKFMQGIIDRVGSTKRGKRLAIFIPAKSTIGQIGKSMMAISYVVPTMLLQWANPLVAIAQQIIPTFTQYLNNVNHGHRSNEKSNGKNIVSKINEDLGIFPESFVTSPDVSNLSTLFGMAGLKGEKAQGILNKINSFGNRYSAALNTGPQQLLDVYMDDSFNKIAIQAVLDRYGSREEALGNIYNPDGSIKEGFREEFIERVKDYKKNTLFKFDNGYDTYHTGGWFMSMLMLNGGRGFSHSRLVFDNLTNGYWAKAQGKALEDGVDPNGLFGSQYENVKLYQNLMNTMLYAYRLQRLLDDEDEEDSTKEKIMKTLGTFTYLYQGVQAAQSAGINRVGLTAFDQIRKGFAAHIMHGNEDKMRTDPEGYIGMLKVMDSILKEAGRSFYFSDQIADVYESVSKGESLTDVGFAVYDNLQYRTVSLLRFFTDDIENEFGLVTPQSDYNYVNAIMGKKQATDLYGKLRENIALKDLVDVDGSLDIGMTQAWLLKKLPHIARVGLDENYWGVYLGDDKKFAEAVDGLKKNDTFFQELLQGNLNGLTSEENVKYTRDILYNYVSNPYTKLQDNSEDNDSDVSGGTILYAQELKGLLGDDGFKSYEESLVTNRFVMKEEQVTRKDILNKAVLAMSAGEEDGVIPAGATQHLLTLTAGYLRDEISKFYVDPKTGKPFKKYNGSVNNPYRDSIDELVGKELLPYLDVANKNDYVNMVTEVIGGRSEIFESLLKDGKFKSEKLRRVFWADVTSSLAVSEGNISGSQMYNIYNQLAARPKKGAETAAEKKKAQDEADNFNIGLALDIFDNIDESIVPMENKVDIVLPLVGNNEELFNKAINNEEFQKVIGENRVQYMKNFLYGISKDIDHLPRALQSIAGMEGGFSGSSKKSTRVSSSSSAVPKSRSVPQIKFQKFISNNIKYENLNTTGYKPTKKTHTSTQGAVYRASTGSVRTRGIKNINQKLKTNSKLTYKPKSNRSDLKRILKILGS